jgi:fructose-1,6-bisphosphatase/inositol monophosphatase family enzyme
MSNDQGVGPTGDVDDELLLGLCNRVVDAVRGALDEIEDFKPLGEIPGQYALDLVADAAALQVLDLPWLGVLSEESGRHRPEASFTAVIDPVDGSTNASRGIPWFATSICILDDLGPRVAVVANQASGVRHHAVRGSGAWRDGIAIAPSRCVELSDGIISLSGYPSMHMGWNQFRCLGAAALDLCAVADGTLDGFAVGGDSHLAPWDYMGALLVCNESGAHMSDRDGEELVLLDHSARRAVLAAGTPELLREIQWNAGASSDPPDSQGD